MPEQMFDESFLDEDKPRRDAAFARFFMDDVVDKKATREAGETIWDQAEFVEILLAGDPKLIVNRKVEDRDRKRWPKQYSAFKEGEEQRPDGFPLTAWPACPPGFVKNLKAVHCYTVEQFVSMPDAALPPLPDIYKVRDKAREFLDAKTNASKFNKLQQQTDDQQAELETKEKTITELQEEMRNMKAQVAALQSLQSPQTEEPPKRPRRGKIKDD